MSGDIPGRRQGAEHFPILFQLIGQRRELHIETHQAEIGRNPQDILTVFDAFIEAMLFVLRQDPQNGRVDPLRRHRLSQTTPRHAGEHRSAGCKE